MANPNTSGHLRDEHKLANAAADFGTEVKAKAQEAGTMVADKARDAAAATKNAASTAYEKTKEAAATVGHKASELASSAGEQAENVTEAVGGRMKSLAGTIKENMPHGGMMGRASAAVADSLESGGRYLQEEGLSGMGEDLTNLVRRNPIPALLLGIGVGFLIARSIRS